MQEAPVYKNQELLAALQLLWLLLSSEQILVLKKENPKNKSRSVTQVFFSLVSSSYPALVFYISTLFFTRCFFHLHFPKDPAHSTTSSLTWLMIQKLKILKWSRTYGWFSPMITRLLFFFLFSFLLLHSLLPKICHTWQGQKKLTQNLNKNWATWNLCFLNVYLISPSPLFVSFWWLGIKSMRNFFMASNILSIHFWSLILIYFPET